MSTLQFTHQQKKVTMRKCNRKFLGPRNGYTHDAYFARYIRGPCHNLVNNKAVQYDANNLMKSLINKVL